MCLESPFYSSNPFPNVERTSNYTGNHLRENHGVLPFIAPKKLDAFSRQSFLKYRVQTQRSIAVTNGHQFRYFSRVDGIRRLVHEFIDNSHICRICILNNTTPPPKVPHNTVECPVLPKYLELNYLILAHRLDNMHDVEKMILAGEHHPIQTRKGTIGRIIQRLNGSNEQPDADMLPSILRSAPATPHHSKN